VKKYETLSFSSFRCDVGYCVRRSGELIIPLDPAITSRSSDYQDGHTTGGADIYFEHYQTTSRVFKVEIVNLSDKSIQGLNYLYAKKCSTHTEPGGGGILFTPEKMLGPGKRMVFDAGDEDPVKEIEIQNCLDNATEIHLQLIQVTFSDGSQWDPTQANKSLGWSGG